MPIVTKYVFLLLYMWHAQGTTWDSRAQMGGPAFTISPMPSLQVCEVVGGMAKSIADQEGLTVRTGKSVGEYATSPIPAPAIYRCIEVSK